MGVFKISFVSVHKKMLLSRHLRGTKHRKFGTNSKITREEMASKINKNIRTIQRIKNSLVSKGYILRIGNNRFGYWEVLKKWTYINIFLT